ncbi:low molecular weight protein arginine phosphatase [Hazenella sp. IB182357]|uniref:Low molecular weight protein arginine phosphatase n=1 Tax=Polycladospora coralii TaxID=2771432 RepID=A0A926RX25_9BACL|nr:low molecular weight protein arginine phosphatase [Polycladospora coralii]MBS7530627.1 low molecular weight protein arginine phosphatase [Polycladospora coralii]
MRILFVCTGNTCRSPIAEALLERMSKVRGINVEGRSAGISAMDGMAASPEALHVLAEKEIKHNHASRRIDEEQLQWADLILTMTLHHKNYIIHQFPEHVEKVYTLKEYAGFHTEQEALYKKLDKLYVQLEEKRLSFESRYPQHKTKNWSEQQMEQIKYEWFEELKPLLQEEEKLKQKIEQHGIQLDIQDPFGGSVEVYRQSLIEIEEAIQRILDQLEAKGE